MIPTNKAPSEVEIFFQYQNAINNLEQGRIDDGKAQLKNLLYSKSVQGQENRTIHYATLISLAEVYGRSNLIHEKCEALKYYHESNSIIEDCWETNRKMAIIFRQIGLIPRALQLAQKALESCKQVQGQLILYYQICCLAFLINEIEYFNKYLQMMPDENKLKQQLIEIDYYFKERKQTKFVDDLLEERSGISKKIAQIPKEYLSLDYFYLDYECELYINESDLPKFFKKLRKLIFNNLYIDDQTDEVHQKDITILLKTFFIVKSKKEKKAQKNKPINQLEKNAKQLLKQKLINQVNYDNQEKFSLKSILEKENKKFIEILEKCGINIQSIQIFNKNTIFQNQQMQEVKKNQNKQINNNQVGQYLITKLKSQKFYIFNLLNQLTELIYKPQEFDFNQETIDLAQRELVKCYIWSQYFMNELTNDPKIDLKILSQSFNEFKSRIKSEKTQTKNQIIKLKNYQRLILKLNDKLLFQISFKKDQKEEQISQTKEFKMIMSQIHNEFNIVKNIPSLINNQVQLTKNNQLNKLLELPFNDILEFWESPDYLVEKGEQTNAQLAKIYSTFKEEINSIKCFENYQKIINACIKQLYFRKTKEQCKNAFQIFLKVFQLLYQLNEINEIIALCCLKLSFIYGVLDEEASQPLYKFLKFFYQMLKFPQKELVLITTLQQPQINLFKFVKSYNVNLVIQDLLNLRIQMKQDFQKIYKNYTEKFQDHQDIQYYLMQQINEKPGMYGYCVVKKNQMQIETQPINYGKDLVVPETYSSESEEDHNYTQPYHNNFKDIKLLNEQLTEPFKIGQNKYQFNVDKQIYLLSHKLSVNLGDPLISNQIKRVSKEILKQKYQITTKQLKQTFLVYFFENYYLNNEYNEKEVSAEELKFFGYFLPLFYNQLPDKRKINIFIQSVILNSIPKKVESEVYQYANALNQLIFQKQPQKIIPKFNEIKESITKQKLQNEYLANIYYLLQLSKSDEKNYMHICFAIAFNEIPYFWNYFYMKIFNLALIQLNQKTQNQDIDWFLCQKKIQVHLQKQQSLAHLFEYRFIMDLLKAQQRQLEYQSKPNETTYLKIQQAYQFLLQQNQFTIPFDYYNLSHNFRAILLIEKRILRKLKSVPIERVIQSIANYSCINKLILQMKEQKQSQFYNSQDGEIESISDLQINVYKYLRRFLQSNNINALNKLLETIQYNFPLLMEKIKASEEFHYSMPLESRNYKILDKQNEVIDCFEHSNDYQEKINVIMVNLCSFFDRIKQRINQNAPQRYVIEAIYYLCHIQLHNKKFTKYENLLQIISIIYSPQCKDFVRYQKQYGNEYSEQDQVLREYYHHDLVFLYQKSKIIKLVIKILILSKKWKDLLALIEQMPKNFDLRGLQICLGLIENQKYFDDIQLLQDVLCSIDYFLKRNQQFVSLNENKDYNNMFIRLYDQCLVKLHNANVKQTSFDTEKVFQAKIYIDNIVKNNKRRRRDNFQLQEPHNCIEIS